MSKPKTAKKAKATKIIEVGTQLLAEEQAALSFCARHSTNGECDIECHDKLWHVFTKSKGLWVESRAHYYLPEIGAHGNDRLIPPGKLHSKIVHSTAIRVQQMRQQTCPMPLFNGAYVADIGPDGRLIRIVVNAANGEITFLPGVDGAPATASFSPERDRARKFNRILAGRWNPDARCPLYDETLHKVIPHPMNRRLFRLFTGSLLLPFNKYKTALVLYGPSDTFKSKLVEATCLPLGDCRTYIELNNLINQDSRYNYMLAQSMANISTELSSVTQEDSAKMKTLIGCEPTNNRLLYTEGDVILTRAKYFMCSNSLPTFKGGTTAENTRLRIIGCEQPFVYVDELPTRLEREIDGIFNQHMIPGCLEAMSVPQLSDGDDRSVELRASFSTLNDPFGNFVTEWVEKSADSDFIASNVLTTLYQESRNRETPLTPREADEFWKRMYQTFPIKRSKAMIDGSRKPVLLGLRLKKPLLSDS